MRKKVADQDFSINDLPQTRKEVFFDCFKNRFNTLLRCGLSFFIYCIPLFICLIMKSISIGNVQNLYLKGELSESSFLGSVSIYTICFDLGVIVSSLVISVGVSGVSRVIRQLSWEEPIFYRRDFFDGVKKNYKQIIIFVLIFTIIYALCDVIMVSRIKSELLKILPDLILILLFLPIILYSITLVNIYNVTVSEAIKNSILLFIKTALISLVFSLMVFATRFISLIPTIAPIIIYVVLIVLGLPLYYLAFFLYASNILDKTLNNKKYPELVGRGTFKAEDKEKETI